MKEAVNDYVNCSDSDGKTVLEFLEATGEFAWDLGLDAFKGIVGKSAVDYIGIKALSWIGNIELEGGILLKNTAEFAAFQSTAMTIGGSVLTGIELGLCLSDFICDSKDKAKKMGKVVAASNFAPYFSDMMKYYEANLLENKSEESVENFEYAFALNKALHVFNILFCYV